MTLEKAEQIIKETPEEEAVFNAFMTLLESKRNSYVEYAICSELSGMIREFNAGQATSLTEIMADIIKLREG